MQLKEGSHCYCWKHRVYENFARTGEVVNSCNSNVTIINPIVLATQEPIVSSLCAPYNNSNATVSPTTVYVQTILVPTTEPLTQEIQSTTTKDLDDITMTTATLPQQSDEVTSINVAIKDGTPTNEPASSTNAITTVTSSHIENQNTVQHNLHYIAPSYVAIGVSAVVLVLLALFGVVIIVKLFRVKPPEPQKVNHPMANSSAYEYPTIKNEHTLSDAHIVST